MANWGGGGGWVAGWSRRPRIENSRKESSRGLSYKRTNKLLRILVWMAPFEGGCAHSKREKKGSRA